jgi:hypothetical protein
VPPKNSSDDGKQLQRAKGIGERGKGDGEPGRCHAEKGEKRWEPADLWETSGSGHTGALLPFSVRGPAEAGGVLSVLRRQVPLPLERHPTRRK